jgi:hypothetical protein
VLGTGLGIGADYSIAESPYARGIFVGERRVPSDVSPATWLDARRDEVASRRAILRTDGETLEVPFSELGIDIDIEATLAAAEQIGHRGSLRDRILETHSVRRGLVDVPIVYRVSEPRATAALESIAAKIQRDPSDARIDLANRRKIKEVVGRSVDVAASLQAIHRARLDQDYAVIDLVIAPVRPRVTIEDLAQVDVSKTYSSFETTFHTFGTGVGRTVNIQKAAALIDGTILPPGYTMSFNELVGKRSLERGFTWAPEIQGDELTTGIGGGTCQVSSTLFGAALFGALDIVERRSHSRPSSYTKMGLDATVAFEAVDLKIKNPLSFPIMIHAYVSLPKGKPGAPKDGKVRVELLGGDPVADVTYAYGVGSSEDFVRRITVKSFLQPGKRIRRQKGSRGYAVTSVVTINYKDGRTEERKFFSGYRPAPEVFWVAPGYDEAELPPLPAHAKGVEGRLADSSAYNDGNDSYGAF